MADEIDMANDEVQRHLDVALKSLKTEVPTNDTHKCIWCGNDIQQDDGRRWCSIECRDEHDLFANKL